MLKMNLVDSIVNLLEENDYITCKYHGCFDVAAKKRKILFLKILQNIDSFQREQAKNLKIISSNFDAYSFLIGEQTNRERLGKGIVYERFEVPALSSETFENLIRNEIFPNIYRDKGGLFVEIDSGLLKEYRRKKDMTQEELAEAVDVNKKTICEHERRQLKMLLIIAEKIENMLERKITQPINLFEIDTAKEHGMAKDRLERLVNKDLHVLGFETDFVKQTPFDVIAKEKVLLISDIENDKRRILRRTVALKKFVSFIKKPALVITDKFKPELEIPVIERSELKELKSGKELIRIAKRKA